MSDLVEWLTSILDEDEAGAKAAVLEMGDGDWISDGDSVQTASGTHVAGGYGDYCDVGEPVGSFIARHDPASVLADIAAKRAILKMYGELEANQSRMRDVRLDSWWRALAIVLSRIASAYAARAGYREEWRP